MHSAPSDQARPSLPSIVLSFEPALGQTLGFVSCLAVKIERRIKRVGWECGGTTPTAAGTQGNKKEPRLSRPWLTDKLLSNGSADRVLQSLASTESCAGRRADLDLLASARIPAGASLPFASLEAAEPGDLNLLPTLQRAGDDATFYGEQSIHSPGGLSSAEVRALSKLLSEFRFIHRGPPVGV